MEEIRRYDLHRNNPSELHFEINETEGYLNRNKGKATKPHRHSFYQLIWFKNPGKHYVDYEVIEHSANTFFFLNIDQIHYFCPESSNSGYLVHFNDFFIERLHPELMEKFSISIFNELGKNHITLSDSEVKKLALLIINIEEELTKRDHSYHDQVLYYLLIILFEIERQKKRQGMLSFEAEKDYLLAISFNHLIKKKIDSFLGIEEFASELNTNSKKLTSISKKFLLDTPGNVIKKRKILEAKRMLANQRISIKEIAYSIGFDQPTYFTKYFKKATGFTPKEFQNSIL
ncbi:AraC family transcriptional regulator [Salegentibacter sp. JZCK2]|uniref:helix-turn-helix domain-containing protein n=1 Tax=Salegentibacter tibetensis TaxID=2873600 RepID=UPI001CCCC970|nr:AraC family transcriptional regulator [Salegentibacter tibetensis]MBZ9730178.1 AraC family transcriptional regulator [Salegentibacter tibetensis]